MASASRRAAHAWREAVAPHRLLLAAKTALAVGVAWAVAPFAPGVADEYPYYAPLGALISMYPTLMGSAKTGAQTLLGLAVGMGLATLAVVTVGPNWWTIPLVVGAGVILSGTGWFGAGREYVPMAALFVLIIGGADAEDYSLGYLVQMAVGVVVGLLVNVLVVPSLSSEAASARVDEFQRQLAGTLHDMANALSEPWPPQHEAWARNVEELSTTSDEVRLALAEADESRKSPRPPAPAGLAAGPPATGHARHGPVPRARHGGRPCGHHLGSAGGPAVRHRAGRSAEWGV